MGSKIVGVVEPHKHFERGAVAERTQCCRPARRISAVPHAWRHEDPHKLAVSVHLPAGRWVDGRTDVGALTDLGARLYETAKKIMRQLGDSVETINHRVSAPPTHAA